MRNTARLALLLSAALLAGACSGNNPVPPQLVQVGWSWNPAVAGAEPLPVAWVSGVPQQLPVLPATGCTPSGSAHAVVDANGAPLVAGVAMDCVAGVPVMTPVTWLSGTRTALPLAPGTSQGSALAVAWSDGASFVAGATGDAYPFPSIWKNGVLMTPHPETLLPPWCDSGIVTSLVVTTRYAVASGVVHVTSSTPPSYQAIVWVLDPDFTSVQYGVLQPPVTMAGSAGGSVSSTFDGLNVYSAATVSLDGNDKPMFWLNEVPYPIAGESFATGPWGVPTGIALVDATPYVTGYVQPTSPTGAPQPVIWTPSASMLLSTADSRGVGTGEGVVISAMWAVVTGESLGPDPANGQRSLSLAALWLNGQRYDLPGLAAPGSGPLLASPLHAWWKVPGTTPVADWPWPGGYGAVIGRAPVSAAGSAVARAVTAVLP